MDKSRNLEVLNADSTTIKFKVCKSVHHRTVQINHQPDATIFQFIVLPFIYSATCFGRFPAHHQELTYSISARPRTQHDYHHDTKVKPEAATAVIELCDDGRENARNMLSCKQTSG